MLCNFLLFKRIKRILKIYQTLFKKKTFHELSKDAHIAFYSQTKNRFACLAWMLVREEIRSSNFHRGKRLGGGRD